MFWILILALLTVSLAAAYHGMRLLPWTIAMAATLAGFTLFSDVSAIAITIVAIIFAVIAVPLNMDSVRKERLSRPFLDWYRKMLPTLSDTERVALEAGTVGWEGELFAGNPDWQNLLEQQWPELTEAELAFVEGPVEDLCVMLKPWENTHKLADPPPEVWTFLKENRFFGMIIPTLRKRTKKRGILLEFIQPGKPQQNAYIERYNRTMRYDWLARPHMGRGGIAPTQRQALVA